MKNKIIKCLMALCWVWGCVACSVNEPEASKEKVLQEIASPVDCRSNVGWSWNNGVATALFPAEEDEHIFTFFVVAPGKMSFSYAHPENNSNNGMIILQIDDHDAFDEYIGYYKTSYQSFSLSVKKGQKVTVKGYYCIIKDIKITGVVENIENPDDPQWDF